MQCNGSRKLVLISMALSNLVVSFKAPSQQPFLLKQPRRSHCQLARTSCNPARTAMKVWASNGNDDSTSAPSASSSVLSFLCPLLKVFGGNNPASEKPKWLEVTTSGLASISRLPYGTSAGLEREPGTPAQPPVIYEFEACPFCRRVREAVTDLDLVADFYPCPKGSIRHRGDVMDKGGQSQFPYMIDPNTGTAIYESEDIVRYLYKTYGDDGEPPSGMIESTLFTGWMPTLLRAGRGMLRWEQAVEKAPEKLLQLYNYENNQFSRLVREVLCELELPYRCISAGKGSKNRTALEEAQGKTTVPYLVDPNTNTKVGDSEEIIKYLVKTYSNAST